jgi:hypothetical protein
MELRVANEHPLASEFVLYPEDPLLIQEVPNTAQATLECTTLQSELFGPGHCVGLGLGLRLKSEIRTRT